MLEERFRSLMADASLSRYTDGILSLVRNTIRISCEPAQESDFKVGQSKIGGLPDLPVGVEWPTWTPPVVPKKPGLFARMFSKQPVQSQEHLPSPHAFIAQFNMQEIASYDTDKRLPESGMLYFFFDADQQPWGNEAGDRGGWRVIYWSGDVSKLSRTEAPAGLGKGCIYGSFRPMFASDKMFPSWESLLLEWLGMTEQEIGEYGDVLAKIFGEEDEPGTHLLGHPVHIQSSDMFTVCQLASNGIDAGSLPKLPDDPRVTELIRSATDWEMLFQIDSDDLGTNWADGGNIYYWIRPQDLKERRFDDVWLVLQCY